MDTHIIIDSLFKDEKWYSFHDTVYNATDITHTEEQLKELFLQLPTHIQQTAFAWGLSDTVFCDEVYVYIIQQGTNNKSV